MVQRELLSQLCSHTKLERDAALSQLAEIVPTLDENEIKSLECDLLEILQNNAAVSWEAKNGCLSAARILFNTSKASTQFADVAQRISLHFLVDDEVRVRLAAGEVLGSLCRFRGPSIYESCRQQVFNLIRECLERQMEIDSPQSPDTARLADKLVRSGSFDEETAIRADAAKIFHDTAGWRNLETSMKCLQAMAEGCEERFLPYIDRELLDLVFAALPHTNRFVRETGFFLCATLVSCNREATSNTNNDANPMFKYGPDLAENFARGLADNWSQVRMAASVATREFLSNIRPVEARVAYFSKLLPPLCLNRYYLAEGVRLYNQQTWALVMGQDGRLYVKEYINDVVKYYIEQTQADNHSVREAGCHAIAELALKIDKEAVQPYVGDLLETLLCCFNDDSWPVRDAACVACGNFVTCFPEESRPSLDRLYPLFFANLSDCIPSVRQGAAESLAKVVVAYGVDCFQNVVAPYLKSGLKKVEEQPAQSAPAAGSPGSGRTSPMPLGAIHEATGDDPQRFIGLEKGLTTFGVAKRIHDNDPDAHTDKPMYSCGSLAPRMGRSGGCMDRKFRRPTSPWEITDGCVHLIAELALAISTSSQERLKEISYVTSKVAELLPSVAQALSKRDYVQHVQLMESVFKRLPHIANGLGKRYFKPALDEFFEPLFYALACDSSLAEMAASECLRELAKYTGPSILRAKVESLHNPRFLALYDHELSSMSSQ